MFRIARKLLPHDGDSVDIKDDILKHLVMAGNYLIFPLVLRLVTLLSMSTAICYSIIGLYLFCTGYDTIDQMYMTTMELAAWFSYAFIIYEIDTIKAILQSIRYLNDLEARGNDLFTKIRRETQRVMYLMYVLLLLMALCLIPWCGVEEKPYFQIYFCQRYLPIWPCRICKIISYFHSFHRGFTFMVQISFASYCMLQTIFQMYLLNDFMSELAEDNLGFPRLFCLLEDKHYQQEIENHLKACIKHHVNIRGFRAKVQQFLYLPIIVLNYISVAAVGILLVFKFTEPESFKGKRILPRIAFTIIGIHLVAFYSQKMGNQGDRFYNLLCRSPWYLWNKSNRDTLRLMLVNSKDPFTIGSSGIVKLDVAVLLQNVRTMYAIVTFLLTLKNGT